MAYYEKNEAIAQAALDYVVAEYAAQSISLPNRRIIGWAGMPLDCEQLCVYVARMYPVAQAIGPESEGQATQRCIFWAGTELEIALMRCVPTPVPRGTTLQPIPESVVETQASLMMSDPHIIARGVLEAQQADEFGLGANLMFGDTAPIADESGALAGIRMRFRVGNLL